MTYCYFDKRGVCKMFSSEKVDCELEERFFNFTDEENRMLCSGGSLRLIDGEPTVCQSPKIKKAIMRTDFKLKIRQAKSNDELKDVLLNLLDMI